MIRTSTLRYFFRVACIWLTAIALLHSQFAWAVTQSSSAVNSIRTVSSVDELFEQIEPLRSALDDAQLELEETLFAMNFDAEEIVRFVTEDIYFQAYPGLLRGAAGTLISRSGNALDQSVLLAKLLKDAGAEARIVRGRLEPGDVQRLLSAMSGPSTWVSPWAEGGQNRVETLLSEQFNGTSLVEPVQADFDRILEKTTFAFEGIQPQVDAIVRNAHPRSIEAVLIEELQDYFWVEHRIGPGDAWQSAHPAFADAEPPSPEAVEYMADSIPAALQHRVRIEVKLERRMGSAVEQIALMSPWERPAANAAYLPQTIGVLPYNGSTADSNQYLEQAASKAELFVLTWNDSIAPGAQVFTLQGDTLPLDALSPAGEFIKQVSDRVTSAVDALSGIGLNDAERAEQEPAKRLGRMWIEYSIIAPGGQKRAMQRHLLDRAEDGSRFVHQQQVNEEHWLSEARAALLQSRSLLVATGPVNPAWLTRELLDSASEGRPTLQALERRVAQADPSIGPQILNGLDPLPDNRWLKYLFASHTATGFSETGAAYLHKPALVSFNHGVRSGAEGLRGYEQIDILFNARRVMEFTDEGLIRAPGAAAFAGVLETQVEHRQLMARGADQMDSAFVKLSDASSGMRRLSPSDRNALKELALAPGAQRAAERELAAGYALLIPSVDAADHWWRIDPETGTATGMAVTAGGYGGATVAEYLFVLGIGIGTLLMYYSFYKCYQDESGLALFCCLVDSWLTGIIVAAFAFLAAQLTAMGLLYLAGSTVATASAFDTMVIAIINFIFYDGASTAISFTDFRIAACGTITGT
ncbi:MAG: transglutaminase domain-containing protein [Pseudomonadota bacterium]